jgi:hypothetical protein
VKTAFNLFAKAKVDRLKIASLNLETFNAKRSPHFYYLISVIENGLEIISIEYVLLVHLSFNCRVFSVVIICSHQNVFNHVEISTAEMIQQPLC